MRPLGGVRTREQLDQRGLPKPFWLCRASENASRLTVTQRPDENIEELLDIS